MKVPPIFNQKLITKLYYSFRWEEENTEIRRQKNDLIDENNSLHSNVERKDTELERLRIEITSLGSQLQVAISAKCKALAQIEEVQSREMNIDFK